MNYKIIGLFLTLILLTTYSEAQQWRKVVTGSFPNLNDIYFVDDNTALCAGDNGTIIKSFDGGLTWLEKSSGTDIKLQDIFFVNAQKGFICGDDLTLLQTDDGGESWQTNLVSIIPEPKADILEIYFSDEQNGWMIASFTGKGWILHTNDGGNNWILDYTTDAQLYDLSVYNGNYAVAVGKTIGKIYYTSDGINWNNSTTPKVPEGLYQERSDAYSVFMVDENLAYIAGFGNSVTFQPTMFFKSIDGGVSWSYLLQDSLSRTYDNLFDILFVDAMNGIAVGGGGTAGSIITITSDGGQNWKPVFVPLGATINSLGRQGTNYWICGDGGIIARSEDNGSTWRMITPFPNHNLYSIDFPDSKTGYASGFSGVFIKTTDGGTNWAGSYIDNRVTISNSNDLCFVNSNTGFSAHSYRTVSKTTDGGNTWRVVLPDTNWAQVKSNSVFFINENIGFVVGTSNRDQDIIYKTTDGGNLWTAKGPLVEKELRSIKFYDENNGVIVGYNLKILYTTDCGESWLEPVINNIPADKFTSKFRSVAYADKNLLYACGESMILRSTDRGATWDFLDLGLKTTLNAICFYNSTTGYAVGTGCVLKTTDSGYTWNNIIDSTFSGVLYDVDTDEEGFVWICGSNTSIYTNKDNTSQVSYDYLLNDFSVLQNYPNPFNPTTQITYNIPEAGKVEVKVYDLLGREVRTLINEYQNAGTQTVTFNAGNISSGIYFYQVRFANKALINKMSLIR